MLQLSFDLSSGCRPERSTDLVCLLNLDKLSTNSLHSKVCCHKLVSLALVVAWAGDLHRLISKPPLRHAKSLHIGRPHLAPADLGHILVILLGARQWLYSEDILWSLCHERRSGDPTILLSRSTVHVFDHVVGAWPNPRVLGRLDLFSVNEALRRRVEALGLLALRRNAELCPLRISTRADFLLKMLLAHQMHLLLFLLRFIARLNCDLLRQILEVKRASVFLELVLLLR